MTKEKRTSWQLVKFIFTDVIPKWFEIIFLPKKDKADHYILGLTLMIPLAALDQFINIWLSLAIVTAIGAAKELVWDKWMGKGTPEFMDFLRVFQAALFVAFWYLVNWEIGTYIW